MNRQEIEQEQKYKYSNYKNHLLNLIYNRKIYVYKGNR